MAEYYKDAQRLGQKEYKLAVSKGESGTLPALDDILSGVRTAGAVDLGLVQIPSDRIAGTKSPGRVAAFAPNFMPILEENTEFAQKWKSLCDAHMNEGIRDPVKAYEYMNRFYIEEGNKRVSVLKFFGAYNIPGNVIRILPERNGDEDVEIYYEFVDFYQYSRINFIEFTKKGSYLALQKALGKESDEVWSEDDQREFSAAYYYFLKAYNASGGSKLRTTPGDAMLSYIQVYGYGDLIVTDPADIKKNLGKMWEEVKLQQEEVPIVVKLDPPEEKKSLNELKKPTMLQSLMGQAPPELIVAFIHDGNPLSSGWVHDHEEGRQHVQKFYENRIHTASYNDAMNGDPLEVIEEAIADGAKLIFTTSPRLLQASLRAAVDHPDTVIMNCSLGTSHRYIRTYYTRMYEVKFILGALAGTLTESGKLGYVCDYPIYGQIAGINAFALGARMTCPKAKVYLEWSGIKGAEEAAQSLRDQNIRIISSQDTARFLKDDRLSFGLSYVSGAEKRLLANPVWKWGKYYEELLHRYLDKSMQAEYEQSNLALNYYWGISAGVADVMYSDALETSSKHFADLIKDSIINNICTPFRTPITTQSGEVVGEGEASLDLKQIITMDYLVENVVGEIPQYEALSPMGKATVETAAGIENAQPGTADLASKPSAPAQNEANAPAKPAPASSKPASATVSPISTKPAEPASATASPTSAKPAAPASATASPATASPVSAKPAPSAPAPSEPASAGSTGEADE